MEGVPVSVDADWPGSEPPAERWTPLGAVADSLSSSSSEDGKPQ